MHRIRVALAAIAGCVMITLASLMFPSQAVAQHLRPGRGNL